MEKKELKIIQDTTEKLLALLDVDASFEVLEKDQDEGVDVVLDTKDSGIVIGHHGDMLESLQLVLSLCISKSVGRFIRISIEVGDYKKNRTDWLKSLALATKERVLAENKELPIPSLKSWERRVIHLILQDDKEVASESRGEGRDRVIIVSARK